MSLDVDLNRVYHVSYDNGKTLEEKEENVYSANITHNLGKMALEADLYNACWRPYRLKSDYVETMDYDKEMAFESSVEIRAKDILPFLKKGHADMIGRPSFFKQFNSSNGWGLYKDFLPWVKKYIDACEKYPEAIVSVYR